VEIKHILKRVARASLIFGTVILGIEIAIALSQNLGLVLLLNIAMLPVWLLCRISGMDMSNPPVRFMYFLLPVNAILYTIPYAVLHWLIVTRGKVLSVERAVARVAVSTSLFSTAFLAMEEMLAAIGPDRRSLVGSLYYGIYGPAQNLLWTLGLKDISPWRHLAMALTAVVYAALFAIVHWSVIKHKEEHS
jgi:hypothetical protein